MDSQAIIRVVLVDDHPVVREGLRSTLPKCGPVEIVGEAEDGLQAIEVVRRTRPDVILMDVKMPNLNGMEASRQILKDFPECKVLALSMFEDPQYVTEMLRGGCSGYLIKDSSPSEVVKAVQGVQAGLRPVSPRLIPCLISAMDPKLDGPKALTERELQILKFIAEGLTSKEIGDKLGISVRTVEKHREHMTAKTGCTTVAQLVRYAVHRGYVIP